jgi:hypothetical protein
VDAEASLPTWFQSAPVKAGLVGKAAGAVANSAWAKVFQIFAGQ